MQLEFHSDIISSENPDRRVIKDVFAETFSGSIAFISNFARSYDVPGRMTTIVVEGPLVNYTWAVYEVGREQIITGFDDWGDPIFEPAGSEYMRIVAEGAGISHLTNATLSKFANPDPYVTPLKVFYPTYYGSLYFYEPFISQYYPYALTKLVTYEYYPPGWEMPVDEPMTIVDIMERNGVGQPFIETFGWKITAMHGDRRLSYIRTWGTNSLPILPSP
jgi:hypothetical protein